MKKYAFLLMGDYNPSEHTMEFQKGGTLTRICTVRCFEEAEKMAVSLQAEGFGALELCGAFSRDQANRLSELTNWTMAIGFMIHEEKLDPVFAAFFA